MYVSTRLAVAAAIASLVAAGLPVPAVPAVLAVNAVLAAAVVLDVVRAPHPRDLAVSRTAPSVVTVGRMETIEIRLHDPLDRPLRVRLHDAAPPSLQRTPRRHATTLQLGRWQTLAATITPVRRGRLSLGPITVRAAGPLRLAGRQEVVPDVADLRVLPALPGHSHVVARLERARQLHVGERSSSARGGGSDFDALREYHPDDEFRRINWIATARAGKPITNLYREERDQHVVLLLDAGRAMAGSIDEVSRFELAIDTAFSLAELAVNAGDRVGMVAFGERVSAAIGARGGADQPRRILELLFDLEPAPVASDYRGAFASVLSAHRRRSLIVLLTDLVDDDAMEPLLSVLPALVTRHLLVVGAVRDPALGDLASGSAVDAESVYLKSAATGWQLARDRAAERLRRVGVGVEDRPPGDLTAALADRYLAIKAAGRL
jgi:uncharacterized protein (DUF58 family)